MYARIVALTDDDLLDFDHARVDRFELRKAHETLAGEHADTYRTHLVAARWFEQWREALEERERIPPGDEGDKRYDEGIQYALREVAAHLRKGDFVPGAAVYDETVNPR